MSVARRRHEAAERKQQQPHVDGALAAPVVGQPAEGNLQQRLRQPVRAQGEPDQGVAAATRQLLGVQAEDRQDDEHAQHAQAGQAGQRKTGAQLRAFMRELRAWARG